MKIEIKEVYKCDHCRKLYQRKKACIKHESLCSRTRKTKRNVLIVNFSTKKD